MQEYNYVIVGSGAAGAVLCRRLIDKGHTVCLIENGSDYNSSLLDTPLRSLGAFQELTYTWGFFTKPQTELFGRKICFQVGRILGGSTSINGMVYNRGNAKCYDRWHDLGCEGWDYQSVLPYFKKLENQKQGESQYHGGNGPITVSDARYKAPMNVAFINACKEVGIAENHDFNGETQEGVGFYQLTQKNGKRACVYNAYLKQIIKNPKLKVLKNAQAIKIIINNGKAVGVDYLQNNQHAKVIATSGVIISAGTVNSPKLLMLSGIGPANHLKDHNIPVLVDLPGVGQNLKDHIRIPILYDSMGFNPTSASSTEMIYEVIKYLVTKRGVFTGNVAESGGFVSSPNNKSGIPDIQFVNHWTSLIVAGCFDMEPCLVAPKSSGSITLQSSDSLAQPIIDPNYLSNPDDIDVLVYSIELCRKIAGTKSFNINKKLTEILPGIDVREKRDLTNYIKTRVETCYHPTGTCKMGIDPLAVVDNKLKVRGIENLHVIDASVIPYPTNANTTAPTMMIAEKAADFFV